MAEVTPIDEDGTETSFTIEANVPTETAIEYLEHGGVLHKVLRELLQDAA